VTILSSTSYLIGSPGSATVSITDGPDLLIDSISAPAVAGHGVAIPIEAVTMNVGNSTAGPSLTYLYFSANKTIDGGDVFIGSISVPALVPGATYSGSLAFTIPAAPPDGSTWYILSKADAGLAVPETNEANNVKKFRAIKIGPDLTISKLTAPSSATAGSTINVTEVTKNDGATVGAAGASVTKLYLSVDKKLDASDVSLSSRNVPVLAANATSSFTHVVTLPKGTTGPRYILAVADATGLVVEAIETNNVKAKAITIVP
jgi:subtilase family serine protease